MTPEERLNLLVEENVKVQISHLRSYPSLNIVIHPPLSLAFTGGYTTWTPGEFGCCLMARFGRQVMAFILLPWTDPMTFNRGTVIGVAVLAFLIAVQAALVRGRRPIAPIVCLILCVLFLFLKWLATETSLLYEAFGLAALLAS